MTLGFEGKVDFTVAGKKSRDYMSIRIELNIIRTKVIP